MIMRMLRLGLAAGGLELVAVAGAAYLTVEHDQGKHDQAHMLCPICWMDKLVPVAEPVAISSEPTAESASA